jgi:hypothetical protein
MIVVVELKYTLFDDMGSYFILYSGRDPSDANEYDYCRHATQNTTHIECLL